MEMARGFKANGFDYVCVSSGNIIAGGRPASGPGFNVPNAARIKAEAGLVTRTAGFIADAKQAEEIVAERGVDQVALARAFLDDPRWGWHAAEKLGVTLQLPRQFNRVAPKVWPGVKIARPS